MGSKNRPPKPPAEGRDGDDATQERSATESSRSPGREGGDSAGLSGALPDMLRRVMALGFSGFFTTEEAIRRALGDTLPQDWVDFAADQSERTRTELMARMSEEMGRVFEKIEPIDMVERLLEGRTIEITAQIRLGDREGAGRSEGARSRGPREADLRVSVAGKEKSDR